ncbi:DUF2442 domain-containing protein [Gordonia malaquae]|uniref:DUF2442 domain-containing protein n=1 Tax=Gordonia malaquae TaxID=410332 RepID=UPI00301A3FA8
MSATYRFEVVGVIARFPACIEVEFADGTVRTVDLTDDVYGPDPGVFAQLQDETFFNAVQVSEGAVSWPGEVDLAPDALWARTHTGDPWVPLL